jgi:hypothetical protein
LRLERVLAADVDGDPGENLLIPLDQTHAARLVELDECVEIFFLLRDVVVVLSLLNPDLGLREQVGPIDMVPMGVGDDDVRDVLRLDPQLRERLVRPGESGPTPLLSSNKV